MKTLTAYIPFLGVPVLSALLYMHLPSLSNIRLFYLLMGVWCVLLIAYYLSPYLIRRMIGGHRVLSSPMGFNGKYYRCLSHKHFIFTTGIWPQKHRVFFNEYLFKNLPHGSGAFLIAHEHFHFDEGHIYWNCVMTWMLLVITFGLPIWLMEMFRVESVFINSINVAAMSLLFYIGGMEVISGIRRRMEIAADRYAHRIINPNHYEVAQALKYLSHNTSKLFPSHPSPTTRMMTLFDISPQQAEAYLA